MRKYALTIVIPVYNSVDWCRQTLDGLVRQTRTDFRVVIIDDGSTEDYSVLSQEYPQLTLTVERHSENSGAMKSLERSIRYSADTEFIMSLHYDDILHRNFVASALSALEQNPDMAFVGSVYTAFNKYEEIKHLDVTKADDQSVAQYTEVDFVRFLLKGNHFAFGSVVYRTASVGDNKFDLEHFDITCDRVFLLRVMREKVCGVLNRSLFFYRNHGLGNRVKTFTANHVFNLFLFYRKYFPEHVSPQDARLFLRNATNNLLLVYYQLLPRNRPSRYSFIKHGKRLGLINFAHLNGMGIFGLCAMVVGRSVAGRAMQVLTWLKFNHKYTV
jgi:glycosyltransferase involved in cell wall biosynthesis